MVIVFVAGVSLTPLSATSDEAYDHSLFTKVLKDHVVNGMVDYKGIKADKRFSVYINVLSSTDPSELTDKNERLAFWINAYNAFTLKLIADNFPVKSIKQIGDGNKGPWDIVWITIGNEQYSLNQIEHEIIRKEFDEPRIHMALVCAARSCPPLRGEAYRGPGLEAQLEDNGRLFVMNSAHNRYDKESGTLYLSELFQWFGDDFKGRYGSPQAYVLKTMGIPTVKPGKINFLPYDWSLNSQ